MLADERTPRGIDVVAAVVGMHGQESRNRAWKVDHLCGGNGEGGGCLREQNADCVFQVNPQYRAREASPPRALVALLLCFSGGERVSRELPSNGEADAVGKNGARGDVRR